MSAELRTTLLLHLLHDANLGMWVRLCLAEWKRTATYIGGGDDRPGMVGRVWAIV